MIDVEEFVFSHMGEESNKRTTERLNQLIDMGCTETGVASFGVEGVVSGLYIEKVWSYSKEDWDSYIEWMQSVIDKKKND